ncbi:MAG: hypothetical protein NTV80_25840 [Verrucomicrobia bacterium]|nr:hypothetical protein [Verrucomicrobiota bacterium]
MTPHIYEDSFEFKRLQNRHFLAWSIFYPLHLVYNDRPWYVSIPSACFLLGYWLWVWLGPARFLSISKTEIITTGGLKITRDQVQEISPSPKGLLIAWQKNGIAHYTELFESQFDENVWPNLYRALKAWPAEPSPKQTTLSV